MSRVIAEIGWHYRVLKDGEYPAPCVLLPDRTYQLFTSDVLVKEPTGTYRCMTGISIGGIVLRDDQVEYAHSDQVLVLA